MSGNEELEQQAGAAPESPGQRLRTARERAGWTPERLAGELCLPVPRLAALEADDYQGFGGEVFVRGYLRRAATVLGLPADELLAAYASAAGAAHPAQILPQLAPGRPPRAAPPGWLGPAAGIVGVAAVLALGWWFMRAAETPGPVPVAEEPAALPVPAEDAPLTLPGPAAEPVVTMPLETPPASTPVAEEPAPATEVAEAAAPVEPELELPVTVELRFEFAGDCWVEVTDAREQRLAYRLYRAGDVARLRGVAPMDVFLGNAEAVRLTVDDKPVAVRPAAGRDGTARLSVGGGTG